MNWQMQSALPALDDGIVAYDSEFTREQSYYPDLQLVQLYQHGWDEVWIFDAQSSLPQSAWQQWLSGEQTFLMHAGLGDLQLLARASGGVLPKHYLDSQMGFAFCSAESWNPSFATVVKALCGVELDKSDKRSDWSQRPLTESQLAYAAADAFYLYEIYPRLCEELRALGRLEWWYEDCQALLQRATDWGQSALTKWYNISGSPTLASYPRARYVAGVLMHLREQLAQEWNVNRYSILSDFHILRVARVQPRSFVEVMEYLPPESRIWEAMDVLQSAFSRKNLTNAADSPHAKLPSPLNREQYHYLREKIDAIAKDLALHPQTLVSSSALKEWCHNPETALIRLDQGFRKALFQSIL